MATTTYTSPYATTFKSALNRGTSYNLAVHNIAKRSNKSVEQIWLSLYKGGLCFRQKFNGQWCYFPFNVKKCTATVNKNAQWQAWQWFTEWCLQNKLCTPEQLKNHTGSQQDFMTWCRKFWGKQYTWNNTTRKSGVRKSSSSTSRKVKRYSKPKSYRFPTARGKSNSKSRTVRRAA